MRLKKKYIIANPNAAVVTDPSLAYSEIMALSRLNKPYYEGSASGANYEYEIASGTFTFDSEIFDGTFTEFVPEKILVIYKQ